MGAIADLSALVNRATGGNSGTPDPQHVYKDARVNGAAAATPIAARWTSLWRYEGIPAHGAVPPTTPGASPDNTTDGSFKQTSPGGGRQKWITYAAGSCQQGMILVYDRLYHVSGLDATNTGAQSVGGAAARYTGVLSKGSEIWAEIYTQVGATGTTITASYTDQDGNVAVTQPTVFGGTGFREAERIIRLPLATGDVGVRSVASATVLATTGTAGNFGITIARPLYYVPVTQAGMGTAVSLLDGPVEQLAGACLAVAFLPTGTAAPQLSLFQFSMEA